MNYSTASYTELKAAGFKVTVMKSQAKRRRKSKWVMPSMNRASSSMACTIGKAYLPSEGCI